MRAVVLRAPGRALELDQRPVPAPERGELLLRVRACGVCRTDLHLVDGELPEPTLPVVPALDDLRRGAFQGSAVLVP